MTLNEKIAEKCEWTINTSHNFFGCIFDASDKFIGKVEDIGQDTPYGNWIANKMQQKMVDDGWKVGIDAYTTGLFEAKAYRHINPNRFEIASANTGPAAIVALFCKVYGILGDEK